MSKVVVTARVKDPEVWEERFRTHGDLFRSASIKSPIDFGNIDGNEVALCFEAEDFERWQESMESPANEAAMAFDGVVRETLKVFVLEKAFRL